MSETQKIALILIVLIVADGITGRMDYDAALGAAQTRAQTEMRLLCWRADPLHGEAPRDSARIVAAIHSQPIEAPPLAEASALRCLVLED